MNDDRDRPRKSRRWLLGGLAAPALAAGLIGLAPLDALAATKKKIVAHAATRKTTRTVARNAVGTPRTTRVITGLQQPGLAPYPYNGPHPYPYNGQQGVGIPYGANGGAPLNAPVRQLTLYNRRNGESIRPVYFQNGRYRPEALLDIKRFMRDWRSDDEIDIDPHLADVLWSLQRKLVPGGCIDMVCGYRSPATNAMLRRTNRGVALNSFHMYGKAMDVRIQDVPLRALHDTALGLGAGGVGYYPSSNFVHVDTGPIRQWGQNGRSWGA